MIQILTTCYNAGAYLEQCLHSITRQTIREWQCYVLDDLSTDDSPACARAWERRDHRIHSCPGYVKSYPVGNYARMLDPEMQLFQDSDICVHVDGDDYLPDSRVLERVLAAYEDGKTWMTWGSYASVANGFFDISSPYSQPVEDVTMVRRSTRWLTSHLRTFKIGLWRQIKPESLRQPNGEFWPMAGDVAYMLPMLEMAGNARAKFLGDINYIYRLYKGNEYRVDLEQSLECSRRIKTMPRYQLLPDTFQIA